MNRMKRSFRSRICLLLAAVMMLSVLSGCGKTEPETEPSTVPETTAPPQPVITGNRNSSSLLCKDSYTIEGEDGTVVATAGEAKLTNRILRIYYAMELAKFRSESHAEQPDYDLPLYAQICPLSKEQMSWQHYFLQRALNAWNVQQALYNGSRQPQPITDKYYKAEPTTHEQFFQSFLPAYPLAYIDKDCYTPNELHQAYLDAIPDQLDEIAQKKGYADADAMAKAMAGSGASADDLTEYDHLMNLAYMYFTELSYKISVDEEELDAFLELNPTLYTDKEPVVNIMHCLMVPENAAVAPDGKVTASEEDWEACQKQIDELLAERNKIWLTHRNPANTFATLAHDYSADGGSQIYGGRYVQIRKGQMYKDIDEWCFDEARQPNDETVIRTDLGYELILWNSGETLGRQQAREALMQEKYDTKVAELQEQFPMSVDYSRICLTEGESPIVPEDLLYPDVAHERYPVIQLYLQQDYAPAPFGAYHVHNHGCGITTMAMVSTYLADRELTPGYMATAYSMYAVSTGTNGDIFMQIPPELGYFFEKKSWDWADVEEALNAGKIVVSLQYHGHFTRTGHYLALERMTEDGKVVIRDSNIYNYVRLPEHKVDCFDPALVIANNAVYWIFEPKITRIPGCSRCGDPENAGIPEGLLNSDYTCDKCLSALERRNGYLALTAE